MRYNARNHIQRNARGMFFDEDGLNCFSMGCVLGGIGFGKTSFMNQLMHRAKIEGNEVCYVDMGNTSTLPIYYEREDLLKGLFSRFISVLHGKKMEADEPAPKWAVDKTRKIVKERTYKNTESQRFFLFIDSLQEIDELDPDGTLGLYDAFVGDFLTRLYCESDGYPLSRLTVISSEYRGRWEKETLSSQYFERMWSERFQLKPFSPEEIGTLLECYGLKPSPEAIDGLREKYHGHPHLTHLAVKSMYEGEDPEEFFESAVDGNDARFIFHRQALLRKLNMYLPGDAESLLLTAEDSGRIDLSSLSKGSHEYLLARGVLRGLGVADSRKNMAVSPFYQEMVRRGDFYPLGEPASPQT
jgi:hypothetical protein